MYAISSIMHDSWFCVEGYDVCMIHDFEGELYVYDFEGETEGSAKTQIFIGKDAL